MNFVVIENTQVESAFRSTANHQYIELMFSLGSREFELPKSNPSKSSWIRRHRKTENTASKLLEIESVLKRYLYS